MKSVGTATPRVVLLGASNLTRSLPVVVDTVRRASGGQDVELLTSIGHGRSYGQPSSVLGRRLPGIVDSGLWRRLRSHPPVPTRALVTDVGNDIAYGFDPERILRWVGRCLERLRALEAEIVVTSLPLGSIERLRPSHYLLARGLFFPASGVTHAQVLERARRVDAGLRRLAKDHGATWVSQRREWYGLDPVHILARQRPAAWAEVLASWGAREPRAVRGGLVDRLRAAAWVPDERWLLGVRQRGRQPAGRLRGCPVSLY